MLWVGVSSFLLTPLEFSWLVFCSTVFLIETSCCEINHKVVITVPGQGGQFWSMVSLTNLPERLHTQGISWELGWRALSSITTSWRVGIVDVSLHLI